MNYIINYFTIQYFDLSLAVQLHFVISKKSYWVNISENKMWSIYAYNRNNLGWDVGCSGRRSGSCRLFECCGSPKMTDINQFQSITYHAKMMTLISTAHFFLHLWPNNMKRKARKVVRKIIISIQKKPNVYCAVKTSFENIFVYIAFLEILNHASESRRYLPQSREVPLELLYMT